MTPFINGIPRSRWLQWFTRHHLELSLRLAQGLQDAKKARSLCPENIQTFYGNLKSLYEKYDYPPSQVWNCDESGVQAGQNGGAYVLATKGCCNVYSIEAGMVPNKQE